MLVILTTRLFKWQIVCCGLLTCRFNSILKFETRVYCSVKTLRMKACTIDLMLFLPTIPIIAIYVFHSCQDDVGIGGYYGKTHRAIIFCEGFIHRIKRKPQKFKSYFI